MVRRQTAEPVTSPEWVFPSIQSPGFSSAGPVSWLVISMVQSSLPWRDLPIV